MLTPEQLRAIMPNNRHPEYLPFINSALEEFEINTPLRQAAFLAQLAHESGELRYMEEIADGHAYEGRADLGNTIAGDGKLYKGRGPIQLTGRANYKKYGELLGIDLLSHPKKAATPEVGFRIAGAFWNEHELNELADLGAFKAITKKINGGYNHLKERTEYYERAKKVLSKSEPVALVTEPQTPPAPVSVEDAAKGLKASDQPASETEGAVPPAPAVEVKASRPSLKSTAVAIITFLMAPLSYLGIDAHQVGALAMGNITLAIKVGMVLVLVILALYVWNRAMDRAQERTNKLMDAAMNKDLNNLRLVGSTKETT